MILRRRPSVFVAVVAAAVLAATAAGASGPSAGKGPVRLNELQAIGTHNSFKRELSEAEQAEYDEIIATPGDYDAFLAYSHASIPNQFALQDVRGLELDLFGDPAGGLYAEPLCASASASGLCLISSGAGPASRFSTSPTSTMRPRASGW